MDAKKEFCSRPLSCPKNLLSGKYISRIRCLGVDAVHHVLETSVNTVAILLNLFLLYLIKCHSTFRVPIYQILLGIDAGLDLLLGIVVLVGQPVYDHFLYQALISSLVGTDGRRLLRNGYERLPRTLFRRLRLLNVDAVRLGSPHECPLDSRPVCLPLHIFLSTRNGVRSNTIIITSALQLRWFTTSGSLSTLK